MRLFRKISLTLGFMSVLSTAHAQDAKHITVLGPSMHPRGSTLHNDTFGLALGRSWDVGASGKIGCVAEGGLFYNSYHETGPYAVAGCLRHIVGYGGASFHLGGAMATAYYPTLAKNLEADLGIPSYRGMIPIPLLVSTLRFKRYDIRTSTTFGGATAKVISNASLVVRF